MTVGVLALQGDFREHASVLRDLGADVELVRRPEELARVSGLVIPGGESSVIDKLSRTFGLAEPLAQAVRDGLPVYGTCAGLIMLADTVLDGIAGQQTIGGLDISVRRNAFGSQAESFETELDVPVLGGSPVHAVFIRAPDRGGRRPPRDRAGQARRRPLRRRAAGQPAGNLVPPRNHGGAPLPRILPPDDLRPGVAAPPAVTRYVALLRGINVNGITITMTSLQALFRGLGFADVKTVLASGNVLFEAPPGQNDASAVKARIEAALAEAYGYQAWIVLPGRRHAGPGRRRLPLRPGS